MADIINAFPGYEMVWTTNEETGIKTPHNMYRGTDVGFGGYVYAEDGIYYNVALLDVGNMHGASILALNKLGEHTKNYKEIRDARMALKAHDYESVKHLLGGRLLKYINSDEDADNLQQALKLILNSTYGIAAANFENPLADPRDVNNIIALRGALFMRTLQDEVVNRGFQVVHIKTDSIKVPNATPELIAFIIDFGRKYGYEFEHEATYEKMCLVNDAVYIAKYDDKGVRNKGGKHAGEWTATGKEFQVPYVFKKLFSHEEITPKDMRELKTVKKGSFYLNFNEGKTDDNYSFVGRVGLFSPVKPGFDGGELMVLRDGKYVYAAGTKGYRWKEAEVIDTLHKENEIDISYYDRLCDEAVKHINEAGKEANIDFDTFVSDYKPTVDKIPAISPYMLDSDYDLPF